MAKLTIEELHKLREREEIKMKKRDIEGRKRHIVVAMGTSGIEKGAKYTLNAIADEVEKLGLEDVIITQTGSAAPAPEPVVEVFVPGKGLTVYGNVDAEKAKRIVDEHLAGGKVVEDLRIELEGGV